MEKVSLTLSEEVNGILTELVENGEYGSKSEAVREIVLEYDAGRIEGERSATEYEARITALEEELADREDDIDELETDVERLRSEKRTIIDQREENTELVAFAKLQQDEVSRRRWKEHREEAKERLRESASSVQLLRWRWGGVPEETVTEKAVEIAAEWGDDPPPGILEDGD